MSAQINKAAGQLPGGEDDGAVGACNDPGGGDNHAGGLADGCGNCGACGDSIVTHVA